MSNTEQYRTEEREQIKAKKKNSEERRKKKSHYNTCGTGTDLASLNGVTARIVSQQINSYLGRLPILDSSKVG